MGVSPARIRSAVPDDVPTIFAFIEALARFERLEAEVDRVGAIDRLHAHLFGPRPVCEVLIAELGEDHVGLGSDFDGCVLPDVIGDVTGVPHLFAALADHGFDAPLLHKLARENWLSCLDRSIA
jgi:hypothetical protein